jgi:hypothetical protein
MPLVGEDHRTYHWGADQPIDQRPVTVSEAAQALGITPEAVRMRIKRGTLRSEKRAGRVYVLLGPRPTTEHTTEQTTKPGLDHTEDLIATLREQVQAERQAHAETRRLLAAALERIPPQLEPPSEPPGASETATPQPGRVAPQPAVESTQTQESPETAADEQQGRGPIPHDEAPQEGTERPWWRRMFGG